MDKLIVFLFTLQWFKSNIVMKKATLYILCLLLYFSSFAQQNWLCIYPDKKVYFENNQKEVYCIRIDSTSNNDSILYPFSDLHEIDRDCYSITSGSWLSKYVALNEDENTIFVNGKNQQILIKNQGILNEIWNVFENENIKVKGEITSIDLKSVLGVEDSVKTISFSVYNHNDEPVNHVLNQVTIEVSKHLGLVKTVNFYYFEHAMDHYSHFDDFKLIGVNEPQLGFQNVNLKEQYYDFQVGDELHIWHLSATMPTTANYENKIIHKYLSRTDYQDSIVYYYERKMSKYTLTVIDGTVYENTTGSRDTLKQKIVKGILFDTEPNEPYLPSEMVSTAKVINVPITKMYIFTYDVAHSYWNEDCLGPIFVDACATPPTYYLGLGGPYYPYCNLWSNEYVYELVYYKKGNTEWGTPYPYNLSVSEHKKENAFNVFPNPTTGVLRIRNEELGIRNVDVFDVSGRNLKSKIVNLKSEIVNLKSEIIIDISNLNSGIYFVKISTETGIQTQKIIKL